MDFHLDTLNEHELQNYISQNRIFAPEINPIFIPAFTEFCNNKSEYTNFQLYGGRGSSKSYVMRKMLEYCLRGFTGFNCRILLLRTTKESAKKSVFKGVIDVVTKDIGQKYDSIHKADMARGTMEIKSQNLLNQYPKKLTHEIYVDSFSNEESTKEKLKGYTNISHVFIEELKELPEPEMYRQLLTSVMRPYKDKMSGQYVIPKVVCAYNTPHLTHWLVNEYFDVISSQHEGYSELKPKAGEIEGMAGKKYEDLGLHFTFSTIYDNLFFKESVIKEGGKKVWEAILFEQYEKTKLYDPYNYYTETLGLVGNGRSGQIYKDWKEISLNEYNLIQSDKPLFYGIDFGFSEDVSCVGEVKFVAKKDNEARDKLYIRPVIYEKGLLASTLGAKIKSEIPSYGYSKFYADHRPEAIAELQQAGVQNVVKAKKGANSRTPQVSFLLGFDVYYVDYIIIDRFGKEQKAISQEVAKYHWVQNKKDGTYEPSNGEDHFLDQLRYSVATELQPDSEFVKWNAVFESMLEQPLQIL